MPIETLDLNRHTVVPLLVGTGADDPYPIYARLRAECPLHYDPSGRWLVASHALVSRLLDDPRFSARDPSPLMRQQTDPLGYYRMVVFQNGERHEQLRRLFAPLFTRKRLAALQEFVQAEVARLAAPLPSMARFDLIEQIARVLPVRAICQLLGFPEAAAAAYLKASTGAWQLLSFANLGAEANRQAVNGTWRFLEEIDALVSQVDADATPDHPIVYFLQLERDGAVEHREMLLNILFLFIAGYGTTLLSIGNSVAAALRNAGVWQALRDDPALAPQAARELQRYDAAVQSVFRFAWEDVEIDGRTIRRGQQVILLLGAANRDPAEFPSPDAVDLSRTQGRPLTYGTGPHSCMGVALAKMQMETLLRELPQRMPDLALATGADHRRTQRGAFHGYGKLWLWNPQASGLRPEGLRQ